MKKKLLLALMALLPLAGFADGFDDAVVKVGKFTYGDAAIPVVEVIDGIVVDPAKYTVSGVAYKNTACTEEIAFNKMVVGTPYYVKITGKAATVYDGYQTYGTITVSKAPLTIQVNGGLDLTKAYRAADPNAATLAYAALDASQLKNGDDAKPLATIVTGTLAYSYLNQPNANAGDDIALTFSGLSAANYAIEYAALNIDISKKNLADVTIVAQQGDVVYTGSNITPAYTLKDGGYTLQVGGTKDYTVACAEGDVHDAGAYTPTITGANNYTGTIAVAADKLKTFNVTKATLSVAAKNNEKTYKGGDYTITDLTKDVVFYGLLGDDVAKTSADLDGYVAPDFALQGTKAKNVGDYTITLAGDGSTKGISDNYNLLFQNEGPLAGKLTIKPAELTVTADDKNKGIGQALPEFTFTPSGKQGGDTYDKIITAAPTMTTTATASSAAGTYPITISGGTVNNNYKLVYVNGTLTVGKVAITLTILPDEKVYGDKDPDYLGAKGTPVKNVNYVVNGMLDGEELTNVHITRVAGENFGKYVMSATFDAVDGDKYSGVSVAPAQFSITARPLTVTVMPQTLANDALESALVVSDETVVIEGLQFEDKVKDVVVLAFNTVDPNNVALDKTDIDYPLGIVASLKGGVTNYSFANAKGRLVFGTGSAALDFNAADAGIAESIELYAGKTKDVDITIDGRERKLPAGTDRVWAKESWNTMVLPFKVTVAELSAQLGYAIVNVVDAKNTSENNVQFKLEMQEIPANTPFCVKTSDDIADGKVLHFTAKKIEYNGAYPSVDAGKGYKFVGAYNSLVIDKTHPTYRFRLGNYEKWGYITESSDNKWTVAPFEAYINLTAEAAARGVTFTFEELDGTTTVIKAVNAEVTEIAESAKGVAEGWYTLNGIKLNAKPTQKGIYIYNGKKVAVQ